LEEAQTAKFDLIRRKLQLQPGMRVVDLGMGWGTAAAYMHEHGKVDVTGVSLAKEQVFWADQHLKKPGLQFVHADFRDHCADPSNKGTYDRVYSIGMLEHVGNWNYEPFFQCIRELLKPDGLAVVHTIGELDYQEMDPFFDKYIFPGTNIPAMSWLSSAWERHLILEDQHNFGFDYSLTLKAWYDNYQVFKRETKNPKYSVRFHRMMEFYLKFCEVLFSTRLNQLWQFVFTPRGTFRQGIERQI
jgi:cyclopropane-fatty-acyl-phospholipid synthase